jgi:hypothetical protein
MAAQDGIRAAQVRRSVHEWIYPSGMDAKAVFLDQTAIGYPAAVQFVVKIYIPEE